jgi:hypothetical protein
MNTSVGLEYTFGVRTMDTKKNVAFKQEFKQI